MTREKQLEQEIAYEKQIFFLLFAAGLAIAGWTFSNAEDVKVSLLYIAAGGEMVIVGVLAFLHRRIKNKMKEIGKL